MPGRILSAILGKEVGGHTYYCRKELITMPEPNKDETHNDFISRCIPVVIEDGAAESPEQAVAVCNGIWDKAKEGKSTQPEDATKHKSSKVIEFGAPIPIMEFKT